LDHPDGMFSVLLSLLPEPEGIVRAEYDLFGTKHSGNASDYGFIGGSRRVAKELAKIMAGFVLAFTLAKKLSQSYGLERGWLRRRGPQ
jgi:hypothetical protein